MNLAQVSSDIRIMQGLRPIRGRDSEAHPTLQSSFQIRKMYSNKNNTQCVPPVCGRKDREAICSASGVST